MDGSQGSNFGSLQVFGPRDGAYVGVGVPVVLDPVSDDVKVLLPLVEVPGGILEWVLCAFDITPVSVKLEDVVFNSTSSLLLRSLTKLSVVIKLCRLAVCLVFVDESDIVKLEEDDLKSVPSFLVRLIVDGRVGGWAEPGDLLEVVDGGACVVPIIGVVTPSSLSGSVEGSGGGLTPC